MPDTIDLREISNNIARKLICDENFRMAFIADPVAVSVNNGVPPDMLPSEGNVDFIKLGMVLSNVQDQLVRYRFNESDIADCAIAVACVVV